MRSADFARRCSSSAYVRAVRDLPAAVSRLISVIHSSTGLPAAFVTLRPWSVLRPCRSVKRVVIGAVSRMIDSVAIAVSENSGKNVSYCGLCVSTQPAPLCQPDTLPSASIGRLLCSTLDGKRR